MGSKADVDISNARGLDRTLIMKLLRGPKVSTEAAQAIVCVGLALEAQIVARHFVADASSLAELPDIRRTAVASCGGIVSFGLAGALSDELSSGDVVVASNVVGPTGTYQTDDVWSASLISAIPAARYAPLAGVDSAITVKAQRSELEARSGAVAVDMESHTIGRHAAAHGLRFVAIRIVIDTAEHRIPRAALECVSSGDETKVSRLVWLLLARPAETFDVLRLAAAWPPARKALVECCQVLGASVSQLGA